MTNRNTTNSNNDTVRRRSIHATDAKQLQDVSRALWHDLFAAFLAKGETASEAALHADEALAHEERRWTKQPHLRVLPPPLNGAEETARILARDALLGTMYSLDTVTPRDSNNETYMIVCVNPKGERLGVMTNTPGWAAKLSQEAHKPQYGRPRKHIYWCR